MAATIAAALLAGCSGSDPPAAAVPTSPAPITQRAYNDEELALYREAVRRVEAFEARNQRFLAAGKATEEARTFYRERLRSWEPSFRQLQFNEANGIKIARAPKVLGTSAKSIKSFQDNAAEVVLSRCTDQPNSTGPVVQEVVVYQYENRTWRIGDFTTSGETCSG